ncbi:MAG TPA: hypothetical protein VF427_10950 [Noviherbaspirillum sp.]
MKTPSLRQIKTFSGSSFLKKIIDPQQIPDGKSLTKASSSATQRAQPPAVGMPDFPRISRMGSMNFSSLRGNDKAQFHSTGSRNASFEDTLLPHDPLNEEDRQTLKAVLGTDLYEKLRHSRHQDGLCHADTILKMIGAANSKASSVTSRLMNLCATATQRQKIPLGFIGALIANGLNFGVPFFESIKGDVYSCGKSQLLEHGVPKDAIAVVICAWQGAIDPDSKQAQSAKSFFDIGQLGGANHAFAVLHVDHENGQVLCCDLDPYRQNADGTDKDVYFKVDKETFQKQVIPRFNGVLAIKKQEAAE